MRQEHQNRPPKTAEWLLGLFLLREERYEKLGDFEEAYRYEAENSGMYKALFWYWVQVLKALPSFIENLTYWSIAMFKNYLVTALRNFSRHKGYTFINLSGLAIGMACCILILLYVYDELSYDRYHENKDNLYRITWKITVAGKTSNFALCPAAPPPVFTQELPEIQTYTRLFSLGDQIITVDDQDYNETDLMLADSTFFNLFTHRFIAGNPLTALDAPSSAVITKSTAERIFKGKSPAEVIGLSFPLNTFGELRVTGIVEDVPRNSHFNFNYIISISSVPQDQRGILNQWLAIQGWAYLLLESGADPTEVESKFPDIIERYSGEDARLWLYSFWRSPASIL